MADAYRHTRNDPMQGAVGFDLKRLNQAKFGGGSARGF
jgi:hypothetical protein